MNLFSTPLMPLLLAAAQLGASSPLGQAPSGPVPKGPCAVCGMHVANFPDWAAAVSFTDGAQLWFDGPKDLFIFLLDLRHYAPKRKASEIATIQVKDYYRMAYTDGRKAFFVLGSDTLGPMGKELVPFSDEAAAKDFLRDHRGQAILTFREITTDTLKNLE